MFHRGVYREMKGGAFRERHLFVGAMVLILGVAAALFALTFCSGCKRTERRVAQVVELPTATPTPAPTPRLNVYKPTPTPPPPAVIVADPSRLADNAARWRAAQIKASWQIAVDKKALLFLRTQSRYAAVEKMRSNGVPAPVIFALHSRESDNSFACHLHEGSSLLHRTRDVPKNRPPPPAQPPFTWEQSAEDAIYVCDRLQGDWTDARKSLDKIEGYNGTGYRSRGVPSPYVWSGTNIYLSGKYVADGRYSASAIDQQAGCAAILLRLKQRGVTITF